MTDNWLKINIMKFKFDELINYGCLELSTLEELEVSSLSLHHHLSSYSNYCLEDILV